MSVRFSALLDSFRGGVVGLSGGKITMELAKHQADRLERAKSEHMTLRIVGPNSFTVTGDSGNAHVIDTKGVVTTHCTCPDYENNCSGDEKCKHQIAYEEWVIDEVIV